MDLMKMDERQKLSWLMANRATIFIIGFVWLGLIAWDLTQGTVPYFMIIMVPVFALVRFTLYQYYSRRVNA